MNIRIALLIAATCAVAVASGPVSDDFHATTLNTSLWTFVNPLSDGSMQLNGTNLLLSVPAGTVHELWAGGDTAVRVMQNITNVDFEVAVKFDTVLGSATQMQGVVVEQDASNFIRFEFLNLGGGVVHLFSAAIINSNPTIMVDQPISLSSPAWMKVKRATNTWTISWSSDGNTYKNASSFTQGLTAARIGPYAANEVSGSSAPPAFTVSVDYFFNTASPLAPDMTITKSHTGNFTQGGTGSYTLTATNSGNGQTGGTVTVTDTLPTGLTPTTGTGTGWSCNTATQTVTCTRSDSLAGGSSYPAITLGVNVASNAPASVTNTATVAGGGETVTTNDSASDVTTINSGTSGTPDLTVAKSHTVTFTQGGTGSYTVTVTNSGTAATSGTVTMSDTMPTGLTPTAASGTGWTCGISAQAVTCTRSDVLAAAGSYPAITLSANVSTTAPSSVTNTATVSGGGETNTSNDSASDVTTINGVPDLTITKSHTATFTQGGTGSYTITAKNSGTAATSGTVTVSDVVPTGLTPSAASGTGWTCGISSQTLTCTRSDALAASSSYPAITLNVNVSTTAPSSVTNTATVSGGGETNTTNDSASDVTSIGSVPDLTITKSHTVTFTQGGTGSYTITATNSGAAATSGTVTVSDVVPTGLTPTTASGTGWTCGISSQTLTCTRSDALAASSSYPAITLNVNVSTTAPSSVTNTATVSGGGETNTTNDSASDVTSIGSVPDLTITKSHTVTFTQGGTGSYTITATNSGAAATSGTVTVSDVVPTGLTPTTATGTGWTCGISSQTLTCTRSDALAASSSYPAITLNVNVSTTAPSSVTNTATVSGGGETNTTNDSASDVTSIGSVPDLTITKSHTVTFTQGGTGSYTITATNSGAAATSGTVTVSDVVPTGLTPTTASGTGWTCGIASQNLTCTRSDALAASSSYPAITLNANVSTTAPSSVTNTATVSGGGETNTTNDSASDVTSIGSVPDLTITKSHTVTFTQGGTGSYTITATNSGAAATSGTVTVSDVVPTGLTPTTATGTGWTCGISSQTLTCTRSDALAASSSYPAITLNVNVSTTAPSSVTNTATVSGGGETNTTNDSASDVTSIGSVPDLTITKSHTVTFTQGGTGSYTITATNSGAAATSGTVTVSDVVPTGLTPTTATGTGWTCGISSQTLTCTRSDALAASSSYPAITLNVNVSTTAPSSVTNTATVSGGGETNTTNDSASDVTSIGSVPDLTITKSHTVTFTQGGTGSYTITATNSGAAATSGTVTVSDVVPTGLTPTTASGTGWTCGIASQTLTCTRSDALAASSSYPAITLNVNVSSTAPSSVTNTATVSGGGETNTTNDSASDVTSIGSVPDLTITKSHTVTFTQGGTGSYTITATNSGAAATSGTVTVSDVVPTGLTPTTATGTGWTCGISSQTLTCTRSDALAASSSYPAITLNVNVSTTAPSSVTNTATVSGGGETNTTNDSASDVTSIGSVPDLTITKSHTGNFTQGGTGSYTITAKNSGTAATSGTVTVSDVVPTGLTPTTATGTGWTCGISSQTLTCTRSDALAASSSYPAITLNVNVASTAPSSVTNTATVSGGGETNTTNDSASDVTSIGSVPDLTITKSHTVTFTQGGTGSYTITATNSGAAATSGTVTVSDVVPTGLTPTTASGTGWTCGIASQTLTCTRSDALAASSSYPAITLNVNVSSTAPSSVTNTATVSGGGETNTTNDSASDVTSIGSVPDLTITKSHTVTFTQGGTGSYTITATNSGAAATSGTVTVSDVVPTGLTPTTASGTGWTCGIASQTLTCTRSDALAASSSYPAITLNVNVSTTAPSSVTNTATVSGGGETNTTNDSASDVTSIGSVPDLTITKSHTVTFTQGGTGSYTITAKNSGAAATSGTVTVSDVVPTGLTPTTATGTGWTCGISSQTLTCTRSDALAASSSYPAITLNVNVSTTAPSSVTNTATVSGGGETNTTNDSASDVTSIGSVPDLTITKSHTVTFTQGGTGSYTITAKNSGAAATSGTVTVSDVVPTGLTPTTASGTGWTCGISSQTLTCTRSDALAASSSYPAITLNVNVSSTAPSSVTNTATVSGGGETNTTNDSASDVTSIGSVPDLTITKSHTVTFTQGGTGSYTITATNSGAAATSGTVTVSDVVPTGLTPTTASGTGWTCGIASQTLTCTRSDALAASSSYPAITLNVNVSSTAPSSVTNTATVSGGGETNTTNDSASDVTSIGSVPDLTITKSHTGNFTQGGTGSYTITAKNSGTAATSGTVTVSDVVPTGLTPTTATGTGWTCGISSQTLTCTRSDALAASSSYPAITLNVNVASTAPSSVTNTATVSGGGETNTTNDSASDVTTINPSSTPVSDDFHAQSLNTSLWTFVNPLGDGAYQMTGSNLLLIVPSGTAHDLWVGGNDSVHVTQPAPNTNFQLEAKFESAVTQQYQIEGILIEQDANNYLRFDVFYDGTVPHIFSAAIIGGNPTAEISSTISSGGAPFYMRVQRTGNSWTQLWSTDGVNYTTAGTFTQAITVARVGPYAGNSAPSPAFIGSVDYFFNSASPISPEDGGGVGISLIQVTPTVGGGTVAWTTDRGASTQVNYGLSSSYTNSTTLDNTQVTSHSATLSGLTCGSTYHYSVTSTVTAGSSLSSPDATFVPLCSAPGQPISDDFQSTTLNSAWTFVNPQNDASYSLDGTSLHLVIPAGINHDVWNGDFGIRMMQTVADADFSVEAKFTTAVNINAPYEEQGIVVEQDASNCLRFSVNSSSLQTFLFISTITTSGATVWLNQVIRGGANIIMRVVRSGSTWTFSYSYDSIHWTPALVFTQAFHVTKIGPYAGNAGSSNNAPAFTATVDYFVNRNAPPSTIDGNPYPPTPAPPVINVWYGDTQTFGQNGVPQQWVNILGDVSDFDEISTLTYTLNGGAAQTLWMGENTVRLVEPGNFNVEIDYASLISGSNTVQITATDKKGRQTIHNVALTYSSGHTWPANYSINWASAPSIQSVAQIVDGQWAIQPDGTVRTMQVGYDRLITLGDRTSWVNYTASANITFNSVNPAGFAVGIIVGWQGHTTVQYGVALPDQPRTGHPFPALGLYNAYFGPASLMIWENTVANPEMALAQDTTGITLQMGVAYTFKIQVTANTSGGSHFNFKVWQASTSEPSAWTLSADGAASQGSIVLASHQADISIGNVTVTGN